MQFVGAMSVGGKCYGYLYGDKTVNVASLTTGTGETDTITVNGVALGDAVVCVSHSVDLQGITVTAYVSAANVVSVRFQNQTGGTIDLASATTRVVVAKLIAP